jgi:hypothetical protein
MEPDYTSVTEGFSKIPDYEKMNGKSKLERFQTCRSLIESLLKSSDKIERQHGKIIIDSLNRLEVYTQHKVEGQK